MDRIYEKLIERIPEDIIATDVVVGDIWLVVNSPLGCGAASVYDEGHETGQKSVYEGKSLKELAMMIDSSEPVEQGISMGAINAYYNQYERLAELETKGILTIDETTNSFVEYGRHAEGRDCSAFAGKRSRRKRSSWDPPRPCQRSCLNTEHRSLPEPS